MSVCVVPATLWVLRQREYFRELRTGHELVVQLLQCRPAEVDHETWELATGWVITAYCNGCFSPQCVSPEELQQFNTDLRERLRRPVDLGTVDWVWERLGRTGPHGLDYRQKYEPEYREGLAALRTRG